MNKLNRFVIQSIQYFFISDGEGIGAGCYQFKDGLLYYLTDSQVKTIPMTSYEEFYQSILGHELSHCTELSLQIDSIPGGGGTGGGGIPFPNDTIQSVSSVTEDMEDMANTRLRQKRFPHLLL